MKDITRLEDTDFESCLLCVCRYIYIYIYIGERVIVFTVWLEIWKFRARLICVFKQHFSVFKQHFTYFQILFHPHIIPQMFSNNNFQFLNTYTKRALRIPGKGVWVLCSSSSFYVEYILVIVFKLSIQFIHRDLFRALKSTTRVFKNRNYMKLGLFFLDFYLWERHMRMMLEFSRGRVYLNKKQEFTRKARDINTNINGGEKKTFF